MLRTASVNDTARRARSRSVKVGGKTSPRPLWLVGLCVLLIPPMGAGSAEEARGERMGSSGSSYEMPEGLSRRVSPEPSVPWRAPDLLAYTKTLKTAEPNPIHPQK